MNDAEAFGPIAQRLGFILRWTDIEATTELRGRLAPFGLTPARATAVMYLSQHEGCDQIALGRALGINRASTMKAVNELEALGAVERRQGRDRRSNALHLTPAGKLLARNIELITEQHDEAFFGILQPEDQIALRALLNKVRSHNARKLRAEAAQQKAAASL